MKFHLIYRIYNTVTGKCYIGVTSNRVARKSEHFSKLRTDNHYNIKLQNAYNKYGRKAFKWQIIETKLSKTLAYKREVAWIEFYDSYHNGYNMSLGGIDGGDNAKPCTWNGVDYPSVRVAASATGIAYYKILKWIMKGYKCDEDVSARPSYPPKHPCTWNGINYSSQTAAAIATGRSQSSMRRLILKGYTCDQDVISENTHVCISATEGDYSIPVIWNGVSYASVSEAARANGVVRQTMYQRLKKGYTCDTDMRGRGSAQANSVTWNGVTYESQRELADYLGITTATVSYRINKGYTSDEDMPNKNNRNRLKDGDSSRYEVMWNGVLYRSARAAARELGISNSTMSLRIKRGYTCDDDIK